MMQSSCSIDNSLYSTNAEVTKEDYINICTFEVEIELNDALGLHLHIRGLVVVYKVRVDGTLSDLLGRKNGSYDNSLKPGRKLPS